MIDQEHKPLSRDDRDEIAGVAAAASRRNKPVHLVVAASVLLVGSLAMAGSAYMSRRAAATALNNYTLENVHAMAYIERIRELRDRNNQSTNLPGVNEPIASLMTDITRLASEAGLTVNAPTERNPAVANTPFTRRELEFAFTTDSVDKVFAWVESTAQRIPGTQVYSISLTPSPATRTWNVNLTFARFERAAGR